MDTRYQVFLSSTFTDLIDERKEVIQTLMQMDCIPAGMELFPAADEEQWAFIRKIIDDCDYYILIIGGRYGSTTAEGISYTEKEYDYAVSIGIHVIAFLHAQPELIPLGKSDIEPEARKRLEAFRKKVSASRMIKPWSNTAELPGLVALSLPKAIKAFPKAGWVRGGSASNPELLKQINELRQRNDELLGELRKALANAPTHETLNLASANSNFHLRGRYYKRSGSDSHGNPRYYDASWETDISWNEIIGLLGPQLFQPLNEETANSELGKSIAVRLPLDGHSVSIERETFATMKLQLLALGFIKIESLKTMKGGMGLFWSLSPVGRDVMLQVRTIKEKPNQ
ncbi:MAG: DUF4062 domain-containing protein [Chthoniobacterales bacterium]